MCFMAIFYYKLVWVENYVAQINSHHEISVGSRTLLWPTTIGLFSVAECCTKSVWYFA